MAKAEINKKWLEEMSKPVKVRKGASEKEIKDAVAKDWKRRGLTK
ncbi:hypothetical protein JOJ86_006026 [Rhodococcus percolatus]|nr:hypothetical protein [Rhodococcus opacus]MBA8964748.1 hypothetical protein [Rhodococcus opacus]MBP2208300.1 hypothetical protein [Rhodococcus opacus]